MLGVIFKQYLIFSHLVSPKIPTSRAEGVRSGPLGLSSGMMAVVLTCPIFVFTGVWRNGGSEEVQGQ